MTAVSRRALLAAVFAPGGRFRLLPAGQGWARTTVNSTIFCQPLVSDSKRQFLAWYGPAGELMLARRRLGETRWEVTQTAYTGRPGDAHNGISLGLDGHGVLHLAWDHHNDTLRYARSVRPGSMELTGKLPMDGVRESRVTYPEFFPVSGGDLLFLYRDGSSGRGDTLLKRWRTAAGKWETIASPLIDGGGARSAYTNRIAVDRGGRWHISWCWRGSGDAATNHNLLYARSDDEGRTWRRSDGTAYKLPITAGTAEVAVRIEQASDLINTGTMAADSAGRPMMATYWRPAGAAAPQFHLVRHDGAAWRVQQVGERKLDFRLSGGGTLRIPVSRPLLLLDRRDRALVIFRDEERGNGVTAALARPPYTEWRMADCGAGALGQWEPVCDSMLWSRENRLHLFHQRMGQANHERQEEMGPQTVSVLDWQPE
jgi:hypothetical protein